MRRLEILISVAILVILLAALAYVYGQDLLLPPSPIVLGDEQATPTPFVPPTAPPSTAAPSEDGSPVGSTVADPAEVPMLERIQRILQETRQGTPTLAAEGREVTLSPRAGEVSWWANGENRRSNTGDSFLYAGSYENQIFISAFRLDLSRLPRGAPLRQATLRLTGLRGDRLALPAQGQWLVQLVADEKLPDLSRQDFQSVFSASADITLFPPLQPENLASGRGNEWVLDAPGLTWLEKQVLDAKEGVVVRIQGPVQGNNLLFAWDSGSGPGSSGAAPALVVSMGQPPPTPPPLPTVQVIVATLTPTPDNVLTVAAEKATATAVAESTGTYTPVPYQVVTPTPFPANLATVQAVAQLQGLAPVLLPTPVPANQTTATAISAYATAVAETTGTFTPEPTGYVTPQLILPSPPPANVATAAVRVLRATTQAVEGADTPTPLPYNAVIAQYLFATATPASPEEAATRAVLATAVSLTTGTPAPLPWNVVVLQPYPTATPVVEPTPLVVYVDQWTPTPIPSATAPVPDTIPPQMVGQILFLSDREGGSKLFSLDPVGGRIALITQSWPYQLAKAREPLAPFNNLRVTVQNDERRNPQVYVYDPQYNVSRNISQTGAWSYDPVWSPQGSRIAFVSQEPGNDEIFVVDPDGQNRTRLTFNTWEWDKHPTWSPDSSQIVFYSNRETGRRQLWIMDADGANQRFLLQSPANDWDPVWVK